MNKSLRKETGRDTIVWTLLLARSQSDKHLKNIVSSGYLQGYLIANMEYSFGIRKHNKNYILAFIDKNVQIALLNS